MGGAQRYVRALAAHLDSTRFATKILYGGEDVKWLSNRVYPWFLFLNDWLAVFELVRVFKKEKPSIIHLNSSKTGVLGAIAVVVYKVWLRLLLHTSYVLLPRVVFTAHGWVFNPSNSISTPVRFFYILLHRFAVWLTDTIICVSEYDRTLALRFHVAPTHKLVTIHNGIDPDIPFLAQDQARKEIYNRIKSQLPNYQLPITGNWIGSLGRLVKEKNYATLIEAAHVMATKYPPRLAVSGETGEQNTKLRNVVFFIIGDGYEHANRKSQIANLKLQNRFFLIPGAENDRLLLKAFDVFVLPSIKEGLPYTLLEAMAAGIPAVVTNVGGMPEVAHHCNNVSMVPPRNPSILASEIKNALRHETRTTPCVPFPLQTMITETERIYTGL